MRNDQVIGSRGIPRQRIGVMQANALAGPAPAAPSFRCRFKSPAAGSLSPPIVIRKNDRSVCHCFALPTIESADAEPNLTVGFASENVALIFAGFLTWRFVRALNAMLVEERGHRGFPRSATGAERTAMKASATSTNPTLPS